MANADSTPVDAEAPEVAIAARTVLYTPEVYNSPRGVQKAITFYQDRLNYAVRLLHDGGLGGPDTAANFVTHSARNAELLVVDEADRLKTPSLEQIRDHYDRTGVGVVLIGMPGIEKRLARYPQLYSRVGFVHHYRPLSPNEQQLVLARHWPHLALNDIDDFTTAEAVAAITRITSGNFRLTSRLVAIAHRSVSPRPARDAAFRHASPGDCLIIERLSRLAAGLRNPHHLLHHLDAAGVGLRCLDEPIDTTTPDGDLVLRAVDATLELRAAWISEVTAEGLAAARARGRHIGSPGRLTPEEIDLARQMHTAGHPAPSIASMLKVTPSTIYRYLRPGTTPDTGEESAP